MKDQATKHVLKQGAVTFLDVLGWTGIWRHIKDAHKTLFDLIEDTRKKADDISREYLGNGHLRGKHFETTVLSVSDTITMFTEGTPNITIEIHSRICAWLLENALVKNIPLRGTISYGNYITEDHIMVGYAVDEVASWHEMADWIGVTLSPSAVMRIGNKEINAITVYDQIPYKNKINYLSKCVDWKYGDITKLYEIIYAKGPLTPEIAPKYLNTLYFLNRQSVADD